MRTILMLDDDFEKLLKSGIKFYTYGDFLPEVDKNEPIKKETDGFIYIIKAGNYYKIGRSKNFKTRRHSYITENPEPIKVVLQIPVWNAEKVEKDLHKQFEGKRHRGEWFKLELKDIKQIKIWLNAECLVCR